MHTYLWILPLLRLVSAANYVPLDEKSLEKGSFFEQFLASDLSESGWITSRASKIDGSSYKGQWTIKESHKYPGYNGEKGLVMVSEADFFAISKLLPTPVIKGDQDLVLQYEVKFQDGVTCGGAYLKLVSDLDPLSFSDNSRYEIMFGPDICGTDNGVQLLVKQGTDSKSIDSKLRTPPMARTDALSTLYTLIIRANHDMEIRINGGVAKAGNLLNTPNLMVPPLSVPEYIPDLQAEKPDDWDDRPLVFDDTVEKPADYDELYNSMWIVDPDVSKPEGWNDDESEPLIIANPEASKPEEWDDEEDGEWKPPMIANPNCVNGCGKWEAPKVVNPNYKGEWIPPAIENPNYMGEWKRPLIANPHFGKDNVFGIRPINGIGIDVWSMQPGVMFSNIYLGQSVEEAERIGNATYIPKSELEYDNYKVTKPRAKYEPKAPPKTFDEILEEESTYFSVIKSPFVAEIQQAKALWRSFQADPVITMLEHPFRFAGYCFVFVFCFTLTFGIANVLLFLFLSSREEAKINDKKDKPEVSEKENSKKDQLTEEEVIAKITGKTTGVSTRQTGTRKIR
ncbi:hypothetical protein JCM33374_g2863 [Metschnikowia sp. JCM 33374]|nr:hypothetical protein JCM33374_g2863 [Metschnikowia sp. JCM 33374]